MRIAILTADENIYLPAFFLRLFKNRDDIVAVFCTPPGHGKTNTRLALSKKYICAFGYWNFFHLMLRTIFTKSADVLGFSNSLRAYSVPSAANVFRIPCELIDAVNDSAFLERLKAMEIDLIVSVSCPQIFRKNLIAIPKWGCLNIHGAPLPNYRGLLPSFWMMAKGEIEAAVTVFFVNEGIDSGDVVVMERFAIDPEESLDQFLTRSKQLHCDALVRAINLIEQGIARPYPLDTAGGSYFGFPTRADFREFRLRGRKIW